MLGAEKGLFIRAGGNKVSVQQIGIRHFRLKERVAAEIRRVEGMHPQNLLHVGKAAAIQKNIEVKDHPSPVQVEDCVLNLRSG